MTIEEAIELATEFCTAEYCEACGVDAEELLQPDLLPAIVLDFFRTAGYAPRTGAELDAYQGSEQEFAAYQDANPR